MKYNRTLGIPKGICYAYIMHRTACNIQVTQYCQLDKKSIKKLKKDCIKKYRN